MGDGGGIRVGGGAGGVTAGYDDMLAYADRIDAAGDHLISTAGDLSGLLVDGDILAAAVLCPGEVAAVEEALLAAAGRATLDSLGMESQARWLRTAVWSYQALDAALAAGEDLAWDVAGWTTGALLPVAVVGGGLVVVSNPWLRAQLDAHRDEIGPALQETLYDHPWLQEALTRMAPGMVQGTTYSLSSVLGPTTGPLLLGYLTDGAWPSGDYTTSVAGLMNLANKFGAFEDTGGFTIDRESGRRFPPIDLSPDNAVQTIFDQQTQIGADHGTVRIIELDNGSFIVQIPGTQAWAPTRGDNPVDLTTNVALMAGRDTELERLVAEAMREIPSDAPVMLTGHSQGGITAAALASDPSFRNRFDVQSVVTGGSPIARYAIPDDISVLSMEHDQDPVPKLEGLDNPDRPTWVTVDRELSDLAGTGESGSRDPFTAHGTRNYAETGRQIDSSRDPSIERWRQDNHQFFGSGTTSSFRISPP